MAVRDIIQAAGGSAATSAATYVEDVFSTYLYSGTGASRTITNGIDLATKGGLVWIKGRTANGGTHDHRLLDTTRVLGHFLTTSDTLASTQSTPAIITSYNSDGFGISESLPVNRSGESYASWTFRKQAKFFDVVTYTGTGSTRTVAHNLGCVPGMIIVKRTDDVSNWRVYHSGISLPNESWLHLNATFAAATSGGTNIWNVTSTTFQADTYLGLSVSGATYVAYLFADSNSGGFGAAGTDSVVACGSYTGSTSDVAVTLGWEPQYILIKNILDGSTNWVVVDNMRGMPNPTGAAVLWPNLSGAEASQDVYPTATGFVARGYNLPTNNGSGNTYIYLAIRRGPMKTPTDATKVFNASTRTGTNAVANITSLLFPTDLFLTKASSVSWYGIGVYDRLRGSSVGLATSGTSAEAIHTAYPSAFTQSGYTLTADSNGYVNYTSPYIDYNFRRSPGFFDVVCYTGTGSATTVAHNLGVAPELIIVKRRNSAENWCVYTASLGTGSTSGTRLDSSDSASFSNINRINATPTSSVFSVGSDSSVNALSDTYVAYLFATCPGVSKVFSFTGNGSSQTIDCGFTSGARFVLIKRTDSTGDWYVWDTARGINPGNDPHLSLNTTAAEVTTNDTIDTAGSGFIVNQVAATNVNVNNATYIGLAIA